MGDNEVTAAPDQHLKSLNYFDETLTFYIQFLECGQATFSSLLFAMPLGAAWPEQSEATIQGFHPE